MTERGITPDQLSAMMADQGKACTPAAIRYHCRDPRGVLYGKAQLIGRSWVIDRAAAADFALNWERYKTLRKPT